MTTPPDQPDWPTPPSPPSREEVPREVLISFWLWIAAAGIQLLGALLNLGEHDNAADTLRQQNTSGLTEEQIQAAASVFVAVVVAVGFIVAALLVWFALKARAGRNWARFALLVLGGLVFLFQVLALIKLGILIGLIVLGAIIALVLKPSVQYFAANRKS